MDKTQQISEATGSCKCNDQPASSCLKAARPWLEPASPSMQALVGCLSSAADLGKDYRNLVSLRHYPSIPLPNLTEGTQLMERKGKGKEGENWTKRDRQSYHIIFVLTGCHGLTPDGD